MNSRMRRVVVYAVAAVAALSCAATFWITAISHIDAHGLGEKIALVSAFLVYLVAGLVILSRRPGNALSWVLITIGLLATIGAMTDEYAAFGLADGGDRRTGAVLAAWVTQWWWLPTISLVLIFVPLLFPTGRPPSPRWRWVVWLAAGTVTATTIGAMLSPVLNGDSYTIVNPVGVAAIGDIEDGPVGTPLFALTAFCMACALVSIVVRFRRSKGVERQQQKWFVYTVVVPITIPLLEELGLRGLGPNSNVGFAALITLPPIAIGIAVTRYRLYEIDRLISRTLTYAALTAVLLGLYLGAVTTMTRITAPVTQDSPLAVAAATLLAAAAFGPARRRIQHLVDRRFNRSRYDAARTVDHFRSHLRDEIDLASITASVQDAVDDTVQPSRVVVWLRQEAT